MQMLQASPPEEFLNLLLQGAITKTHTNWLTASKKKFTQVDFNQLLSKCESARVLSEISRIIQLDDLSSRTSHFTNAPLHHMVIDLTSKPALEDISTNSTVCVQRNRAPDCVSSSLASEKPAPGYVSSSLASGNPAPGCVSSPFVGGKPASAGNGCYTADYRAPEDFRNMEYDYSEGISNHQSVYFR